MGNVMACGGMGRVAPSGSAAIKLVHINGLVEEFNKPLMVCEARQGYTKHFVCDSHFLRHLILSGSAGAGSAAAIPDDEYLEMGEVYFLLPLSLLESSDFNPADIAKLLSKARNSHNTSTYMAPLPAPANSSWDLQRSGSNGHDLDADQSTEERHSFVEQALAHAKLQLQKAAGNEATRLCADGSDPQLQTAFTNYVFSRSCTRVWRPPLDTINETLY